MAEKWRLFGRLFERGTGKRSVQTKLQVHRQSEEGNWDTKLSGSLTIPQWLELRAGLARSGLVVTIDTSPSDIR